MNADVLALEPVKIGVFRFRKLLFLSSITFGYLKTRCDSGASSLMSKFMSLRKLTRWHCSQKLYLS